MKNTEVYIYNNISKTIIVKEFKSKKDANNFIKSESRFNKINDLKYTFLSLQLFTNIYKK